ncbi:hypothetical protein pb186bvf_001397 [Paramecium bursaria]
MKQKKVCLSQEIKRYKIPRLDNSYQFISPGCFKVVGRPDTDYKDCMTYIKLRNLKCSQQSAITFCTKKRCRVDTTQLSHNGPSQCRIIKLKESSIRHSYNGWSFGNNTQYDVGQPEVMLIDNLEQRLHDRQDLAAAQFRQQLENYDNDQKNLKESHTFNLRELTRIELFNKLKKINDRPNTPQVKVQHVTERTPLKRESENISPKVLTFTSAFLKRYTMVQKQQTPNTNETEREDEIKTNNFLQPFIKSPSLRKNNTFQLSLLGSKSNLNDEQTSSQRYDDSCLITQIRLKTEAKSTELKRMRKEKKKDNSLM